MNLLEVRDVGPIKHATVEFGDLTILVGPQASGKSVFLQMLKFALDRPHIVSRMREAGLNFDFNLMDLFLGPGFRRPGDSGKGHVFADGDLIEAGKVEGLEAPEGERVFYIPANRSICYTREGWIRSFSDFNASDPFTVRDFSEEVRSLLELGYRRHATVFPAADQPLMVQKRVGEVIFAGFQIAIDRTTPQKRLVLRHPQSENYLLLNSWSAGQREFIPLLLGINRCLPGHNTPLPYPWLIIEEPELGLHPEGIMAAMGALLELFSIPSRPPVRLCVSTHSNAVLDIVWALRQFQSHAASHRLVLKMLGLPSTPELESMAQRLLQKKIAVYYFDRNTGTTSDISNLDPGSADAIEAGWGGLTGWSGEIGNLVAAAVSMSESAE